MIPKPDKDATTENTERRLQANVLIHTDAESATKCWQSKFNNILKALYTVTKCIYYRDAKMAQHLELY